MVLCFCTAEMESSDKEKEIDPTSILIQNIRNGKCLTIQKLKTSYASDHPIDAQWEATMASCSTEDVDQSWFWSASNQLVHHRTRLLLSSTSQGLLVLLKDVKDQSALMWQCNGFHIEQPHTSQCLTATVKTGDQALDLERALLSALTLPAIAGEVTVGPCDAHNEQQLWSLYHEVGDDTPPASVCDHEKSHAALECYIEEALPYSWTRCNNHGYFVSGFRFNSSTLNRPVKNLICCKSSYTFWNSQYLQNTADISCAQYLGEGTSYSCPTGHFLRGVLQSDGEMRIECCLPLGEAHNYSYCYQETGDVNGLHACLSKKYHVVAVEEIYVCSNQHDEQCSRALEMKCCI